jgi:hypothetical protein
MRIMERGIECESGRLASASYGRFETRYPVSRFYDDGAGPVWIYQDAGGLLGIIRAETFETAWDIACDEVLDDADPAILADCMTDSGLTDESGELPEGFGFRPNGDGSNPWNQTGIYSEDLNGSNLRLLTSEDMDPSDGLGIVLSWESWDERD